MGRLERIWIKPAARAPMTPVDAAELGPKGLLGNAEQGRRNPLTVLSAERWHRAEAELGTELDPELRRANLLVSGIDLVDARGEVLTIGRAQLTIGRECTPCRLMDDQHPGLMDALRADWGGGAYATVLTPGPIQVGDPVALSD
ncbi:MAG TPA: MOSC domain-containing protein [Acidimicrobiales bacterium]|nr:MOSC domain-containing protein [Acidimicrobiales bacterium]